MCIYLFLYSTTAGSVAEILVLAVLVQTSYTVLTLQQLRKHSREVSYISGFIQTDSVSRKYINYNKRSLINAQMCVPYVLELERMH